MKSMHPIHKSITTALCVLTLSPALVFAGNTAKTGKEEGVIKSVDMSAHTLVVTDHKKNTDQKFLWNDQTKFMERDKSASANALSAGEHVRLTYTAGSPDPTLLSVKIAPAKTAKPTAGNNSPAQNTAA